MHVDTRNLRLTKGRGHPAVLLGFHAVLLVLIMTCSVFASEAGNVTMTGTAGVAEPEPEFVTTGFGSLHSIAGINRARNADELILFTPEFGTHTMTNQWGAEVAVIAGRVVALRGYGDTESLEIPRDGYVLSGHGAARGWVEQNLYMGAEVRIVDSEGNNIPFGSPEGRGITERNVTEGGISVRIVGHEVDEKAQTGNLVPIVHQPLVHEEELFGYTPWYVRNEVSFDSKNRPYIRSRSTDLHETGFIQTMREGRWVNLDFTQAVATAYPNFEAFVRGAGSHGARVVFDAEDHMYTVVRIRLAGGAERNVLLYSTDYGESFHVYELPNGEFDIEHWVGHNTLHRPPLIAIYEFRAAHAQTYASYNNFYVIQPRKDGGGLVFEEPVLVTKDALSPSRHSGHASFAVSSGDKTFITWIEVGEPTFPGSPTYVAAYDATTNTVGPSHLLTYAPPVNDSHNTPGICIDSRGFLHVISGSHGANFYYTRSLQPYSVDDGWTTPEPVLTVGAKGPSSGPVERGRQTYLSLVCDADDTLHIVYRQWREGVDSHFGGRLYGALSYQRKRPGEAWSEPTVLIIPAVPDYSIFYHKLSLDRLGRLYLSYSFKSPQGPYALTWESQSDFYTHRAVLMSDDAGTSWRLATSEAFSEGVLAYVGAGAIDWAPPGTIEGYVTDEAGKPIAGAQVRVGPMHTETDDAGRFVVAHIYLAEVPITVEAAGYHLWRSSARLPAQEPLEVRAVLTPAVEEAVDFAELWSAARLKLGARHQSEGQESIVSILAPLAGITFDFRPEEHIKALAFEARLEPSAATGGEFKATLIGPDGQEEVRLDLDLNWQEFRLAGLGDLTRVAFVIEKGNNHVLRIRNVRLVR